MLHKNRYEIKDIRCLPYFFVYAKASNFPFILEQSVLKYNGILSYEFYFDVVNTISFYIVCLLVQSVYKLSTSQNALQMSVFAIFHSV